MNTRVPLPVSLAIHRYPATVTPHCCDPIVLLHGWGCDSNSWQPLLSQLRELSDVITIDLPGFGGSADLAAAEADQYELLLQSLATSLPPRATLLGWSLGGMLATALAARLPRQITRLVTLAANAKFVASRDYPQAMPLAVNRQFNQGFAADPAATFKVFNGLLAQGDSHERSLRKALRAFNIAPRPAWLAGLRLLSKLDNRAAFSALQQPGLHMLAEADALVPVAAAQALSSLNPRQQVRVIGGAAHALHWSQPEPVMAHIAAFLKSPVGKEPAALDKRKVAQSFSRAAATYDAVAKLQRDVGQQLLQMLPDSAGETWVDVGCGTGFFSEQLRKARPDAQLIGLDIAQGMLQYARTTRDPAITWLCGDAEHLPLQSASVDLIFSSLAIQWCDNLPRLFTELKRVLKPGGYCLFATLGPETLHELKRAWQQVDGYVHVNRFQTAAAAQDAAQNAGFTLAGWRSEARVLRYEKLTDLTHELKALGAHNVNHGQSGGLTGRHKVEMFKQAYEQFRCEGYLPASYEVIYGVLRA